MLLAIAAAIAAANTDSTLVVSVQTQNSFFRNGDDIGPMNPHDYRPNEFVANDFIFEGLTSWDGLDPAGLDGIVGNEDDYVAPSLATSWTTHSDNHGSGAGHYIITFTLRPGVSFHDGSPWNAAAAVANFDQIMGGHGTLGSRKVLRGMHDWLGFTQALDAWEAIDEMTFSLTFTSYYEAALRELSTIRPFRMSSVAALPSLADMELSHLASRGGALRNPWPPRCNADAGECFVFRGVAAPIGTGPYQVVDKLLNNSVTGATRRLPAADFNATCYITDACVYNENEYVSEVLFKKVDGHWKDPTYDNVILRAYASQAAVSTALQDGSLDIAYGVNTLSPSAFISLATAEGGSHLVAHQSPTDLNVRNVVINSGTILTSDLRKYVMGAIAPGRQALYEGELAEERPMNTLFDPELPHCGVLSTLSTPEELAATGSPDITGANFTRPLRLLYRAYEPHSVMIAAEVQAALFAAGIQVTPLAVQTRDAYNDLNCNYLDGFSYDGSAKEGCDEGDYECLAQHHSWDLSVSQTWGPPYDPTSKLWDMTHFWCSGESDAPAVINMESMPFDDFRTIVRDLSSTQDDAARQALYDTVLTTLHNEAIFLPISAKRQVAVTNVRVSGFQFGFMEFDLPLANLFPTPPEKDDDDDDLSGGEIAGIVVGAVVGGLLLLSTIVLISKEKAGTPIFTSMQDVHKDKGAPPQTEVA
mmetsp:Transcript_20696/g.64810  ORF Transcript_20696/g.64810 Transcript_20696/m.64810 type:complete len:702 (-) Transcript_20696:244-2349(-)